MKLAVVATHPIQYQVPIWKALAERGVDLRVFYATRHAVQPSHDREFGESFAWDLPLLDGYPHEFCRSVKLPGLSGPVHNAWPVGLRHRFAEERFDAVYVHGYATGAAWAALAAAWSTGTAVLMGGDTHNVGRTTTGLRPRVKRLVLPRVLRRVDRIISIGTWNHEYWRSFGVPESRIRRTLYSVDNDRFASATEEQAGQAAALRKRWHASDGDTVFIYCAKLIPKKAPHLLLEAFSGLPNTARLVMVGSGEMAEALQNEYRCLGDRIVWAGFVNQTDLPTYYAAADVFVLPSTLEPWGLVVNEAMASGLPCIVSDRVAAGGDLIEGQNTGTVFRSGDAADLQGCLEKAMDPALRRTWRNNVPAVIDRAHLRHFADALEEGAADLGRRDT